MSNIIYIDTDAPDLVIRVPGNESDGPINVVPAPAGIQFDLVNTLKAKTMREVRAIARRNGLKLANTERMAVTHSA